VYVWLGSKLSSSQHESTSSLFRHTWKLNKTKPRALSMLISTSPTAQQLTTLVDVFANKGTFHTPARCEFFIHSSIITITSFHAGNKSITGTKHKRPLATIKRKGSEIATYSDYVKTALHNKFQAMES